MKIIVRRLSHTSLDGNIPTPGAPKRMSMKIYYKALIILAVFSSMALIGCRSGTETLQNEPRGFRGIKWGTDVYRVPGLVLLETNGKKRIYARDCDELTLDKTKVEAIFILILRRSLLRGHHQIHHPADLSPGKKADFRHSRHRLRGFQCLEKPMDLAG